MWYYMILSLYLYGVVTTTIAMAFWLDLDEFTCSDINTLDTLKMLAMIVFHPLLYICILWYVVKKNWRYWYHSYYERNFDKEDL